MRSSEPGQRAPVAIQRSRGPGRWALGTIPHDVMVLGNPTDRIEMPAPKCLRCGAEMQEGYAPEPRLGHYGVPFWVAGKPDFGPSGVPTIEGKQAHGIRTFRCPKCGYLESYGLGSP